MKIVLFDLDDTVEDQERDVLLPGAREAWQAIQILRHESAEGTHRERGKGGRLGSY